MRDFLITDADKLVNSLISADSAESALSGYLAAVDSDGDVVQAHDLLELPRIGLHPTQRIASRIRIQLDCPSCGFGLNPLPEGVRPTCVCDSCGEAFVVSEFDLKDALRALIAATGENISDLDFAGG